MASQFKAGLKLTLPLALALGGIGAYLYFMRRPLPKADGAVVLPGLEGSVEIVRDKWGVPHIYASTANDAFFAQGYVHAQDRMWQMEFQRRLGSGRLSEVFGPKALDADRFVRRIGINRVAQAEAASLSGEVKEALAAYSAGVNAHLNTAGRNLPVEFAILHFKPEPWKIEDSIVYGKIMAWGLSTNWETEILRARLVALLGAEEAAKLEPAYPTGHPLVVPPGLDYAGIGDQLLETYQQLKELLQMSSEFIGSNNWVIDGEKSATGRPILANDPHLIPLAPSIWYEVHLQAPGVSAIGASVPGAPGVIAGHNERIAWGVTNSMADVEDLYVERFSPEDRELYEFQGSWERAQVIEEEIKIRGRRRPAVEEVRITRHGPVITPIGPAQSSSLALRWVALEPGLMTTSVLKLNRAANWQEFKDALQHWDTPSQNFVYADVEGNIGYHLAGKIPIRTKGNGMVPVPGWTGEYEWTGFIPFAELPHVFNPPSHFIVTANNRVVAEDFPYFISSEWHHGYRAQRIKDLIQATDKLTVDDFQRIQGDFYSTPCSEIAKHLLHIVPKDQRQEEALKHVAAWDGHLTADTIGGAVCQVTLWRLQAKVFGRKLPGLLDDYLGAGFHPLSATNAFLGRSTPLLLELLSRGDDAWFDGCRSDKAGATAAASWQNILAESYDEAVCYLRRKLGADVSRWRWGRLHQVTFSHVFANLAPLDRPFSRGPFPMGGDGTTVCQAAYLPNQPFAVKGIPSYRQIVDFSDFRNSVMMHAPGQSGHPASDHYDDFVDAWRTIQYHPMLFDRHDVLANARTILHLSSGQQPQ